jgi:predicted TIM-barrel fold metal-dependent hydrolase
MASRAARPLAAERRLPVVDAHLHCFAGPDDARFPYHTRAPYRPAKAATPERLIECMDGAGVNFAVLVHPEPYQDDHRYLEHCLAVGKGRLKGTCLFFAERSRSIEAMSGLVKKVGKGTIVAARIHAYAPERLPPFGRPELRDFWKAAGELGLAVQLHFEPRHARGFEPLIADFPKTPVIVDHLGRPFQGTEEEHAVVLRWSRFENVYLKLSAIPSKQDYPHRDIAPVVRRAVEAFGPDRMLYGGGFNAEATPESYRAVREETRALLTHLPAEAQAKVLGGTAAALFGF